MSNDKPYYYEQLANESKPKSYLIDHDAKELAAAAKALPQQKPISEEYKSIINTQIP